MLMVTACTVVLLVIVYTNFVCLWPRDLHLWPLNLKFNRVLYLAQMHLCAKSSKDMHKLFWIIRDLPSGHRDKESNRQMSILSKMQILADNKRQTNKLAKMQIVVISNKF